MDEIIITIIWIGLPTAAVLFAAFTLFALAMDRTTQKIMEKEKEKKDEQ